MSSSTAAARLGAWALRALARTSGAASSSAQQLAASTATSSSQAASCSSLVHRAASHALAGPSSSVAAGLATSTLPNQRRSVAVQARGYLQQRLSQLQAQQLRHCSVQQSAGAKRERQPVTLNSLLLFLMGGAAALYGVRQYKDQKLQQVMQQSQKVVGQAAVGGPFSLIDQDGKPFTHRDLFGEFALLYFGFTHCPDICPDELEKLAEALDLVEKWTGGVKIQPVFISVDPERDTPSLVKSYVKEFHPRMIGLTGDLESIKKTSKSYRVYYSKTGESTTDYLVDHSIIHYLINPAGDFVTFFSKSYTAEGMARALVDNLAEWRKEHPEYAQGKALKAPAGAAGPAQVPAAAVTAPK